jgi:hypothetical protein
LRDALSSPEGDAPEGQRSGRRWDRDGCLAREGDFHEHGIDGCEIRLLGARKEIFIINIYMITVIDVI